MGSDESFIVAGLPDFEVHEEIGRGGTSVVYRARQRSVNRWVALKLLHGGAVYGRDSHHRLQIEAEAVGRLEHPHIVPLYEIGEHEGLRYLVLRYFEHGSLADLLKTKRVSIERSVELIKTVAEAVHHAHQRGVLHRDIKPSNLMLDGEGDPFVTDFGLAKLAGGENVLTLSTSVLGTPSYMAPEQASGKTRDAGTPADIYAIGAVFFELLTGRPPYVGSSTLEVIRKVADGDLPRLRTLNSEVPEDLEAICLHCMEREPASRYASALGLVRDLERWQRGESISLRPVTPLVRVWKWSRRRPLIAGLLGVICCLLVAAVAGTTWQARRANRAAAEARVAQHTAQLNAYASDMSRASQLVTEFPSQARLLLERQRPMPGGVDFRGWEWRYLWRLCQPDSLEVLSRHTNSIFSLATTVDGRWLGVGEFNGGFSLWDLQGKSNVFVGENPSVFNTQARGTRVAASPTDSLIAYSISLETNRHEVRLLDPRTHSVQRVLLPEHYVRTMEFSGDGRRLVLQTLLPSNVVEVWDVATGSRLHTWPLPRAGHNRGNALAISHDGRWVAVDDFPRHVVVVDLETGVTRHRFETSKAQVLSLAFSRDTRTLAVGTGYIESRIHLWNLESGREISVLEGHSGWVSGLRFLSDGRTLLSTSQDETIRVWDLLTRTSTKVYRGHQKEIWSHALSSDETTLITGSKDGEVRVWDLRGEPLSTPYHRVRPEVMPWQWSIGEAGRDLWLLSTNQRVCRVHGPAFQEVEWHPEFGTNLMSMMVSPDASRIVVATRQGEVRWHRLKDGVVLSRPRPMGEPMSVVVHSGGNLFTIGHLSSKYALWGDDSTKPLIQGAFSELASYFDWVANGSSMMILNQDGTYFLHDIATDQVSTGRLDMRETFGFAHSPDGRWLAVSSDRGEVRLMDSQDHRLKARLGGYKGAVRGLVFSPDNGRLVTGGGGTETLRFWEMEGHQMVLELSSDVGFLTQIRFTPDRNTVVAQGSMGELMVWTAPSWEEIRRREDLTMSGATRDTNQPK